MQWHGSHGSGVTVTEWWVRGRGTPTPGVHVSVEMIGVAGEIDVSVEIIGVRGKKGLKKGIKAKVERKWWFGMGLGVRRGQRKWSS